MHILIVESNPPEMVAKGLKDAQPFVDTFAQIAPEVVPTITEPYAAAFDPKELDGKDGVIFSGSGVPWSTADERAEPLAKAMRAAFASGLPVWGSCNGLQLAACVLGGDVGISPNGFEGGMASHVDMTEAGRDHPMLKGRRNGYAVPCVHRDEVTRLPDGAVLLSGNAHSPVQAFAYTHGDIDFWGTQYHPEFSAPLVADMLKSPDKGGKYDALAADMAAAETNASAAARLGTTPAEQAVAARAVELTNWLAHVAARKSA